jgi:hypothetical protein
MMSVRRQFPGRVRLPTIEDLIADLEEVVKIAERYGDRRGLVYALRAAWYLRQRQADLAISQRGVATVH